jgi:hypothetical protein
MGSNQCTEKERDEGKGLRTVQRVGKGAFHELWMQEA